MRPKSIEIPVSCGHSRRHSDKYPKIFEIFNAEEPIYFSKFHLFLGKFIRNDFEIASPLYYRCDNTLYWTDECMVSLQQMKEKLCQAPVLDYPPQHPTFVLDTGSSVRAIGSYGLRHLTHRKKDITLHERNSWMSVLCSLKNICMKSSL